MSAGLDNLKHIVVVMMENRSFDHMLGGLKALDPRINGLSGNETNPDSTNEPVKVQPLAQFQGQLDPDPDHHFPAVNKQLFFGTPGPSGPPSMQGFVQSYFDQRKDVSHSRKIMYYFSPDKLPVLTTLARNFAVFNGWFSSVPGPGTCNHAFAHYGTSFGQVSRDFFYTKEPYMSIYERLVQNGRTAKLYHYDEDSPATGVSSLPQNQPRLFSHFDQFLSDCRSGQLPDYSFVEPNHVDHTAADGGVALASDQQPDHDVQAGEVFIATVYNSIRQNTHLWRTTALLIVYSEHGGIYDHVPPPSCLPDGFVASLQDTGTGTPFAFDRLGVRVPAVLISPWVAKATVVSGTEDSANGRIFEHASIPATVTGHFLGNHRDRSPREAAAQTFLDLLTDEIRPDGDCPIFALSDDDTNRDAAGQEGATVLVEVTSQRGQLYQPGYQSDQPEGQDLLDTTTEVEALAAVLAAKDVLPPLSLGLFGDWGSGKSFFMRQLESRIGVLQEDALAARGESAFCEQIVQITFNAWNYIDTNLWASLTSEIFEGLASALAKRRGDDSQEERARVLAAASSSQEILVAAEAKKLLADEVLRQTEQKLAALNDSKAAVEARLDPLELFNSAYRFAISQPNVQEYIRLAATELHVQQVEVAAGDVKSEILELHGILSTILFTMRHTERLWIWILAPAAAVALGWVSMLLLARYSLGGLMGQITAALVAASGFLAWFVPGARRALRFIQEARDAKQKLIKQKKDECTKDLDSKRAELISEVNSAQLEVDAAARRANVLKEQLERLRADRRLADYTASGMRAPTIQNTWV